MICPMKLWIQILPSEFQELVHEKPTFFDG